MTPRLLEERLMDFAVIIMGIVEMTAPRHQKSTFNDHQSEIKNGDILSAVTNSENQVSHEDTKARRKQGDETVGTVSKIRNHGGAKYSKPCPRKKTIKSIQF